MGTEGVELDVVYDTGSDWLAIEGSNCSSCEGDTFDGSVSGTRLDPERTEKNYGSASLTGHTYLDKVCIDNTACVESFEYFLIDS
jgi:hypothetical protein